MQEKSPYLGEGSTECVASTPYKGNLLDNYDERVQGSTPPPGDNIEQQQLDIIQTTVESDLIVPPYKPPFL